MKIAVKYNNRIPTNVDDLRIVSINLVKNKAQIPTNVDQQHCTISKS